MIFKNIELEQMIESLMPYLNRKDIIGYAAARNVRVFRNAIVEYASKRDELISKYGEAEKDKNGNKTGRYFIKNTSPNIKAYATDISEFAIIEHDVTIFKIPYDKVIGELTGSEILDIDWMLEDSDSSRDCK